MILPQSHPSINSKLVEEGEMKLIAFMETSGLSWNSDNQPTVFIERRLSVTLKQDKVENVKQEKLESVKEM